LQQTKAKKGGVFMSQEAFLVGLILYAIVLKEIMKKATYSGRAKGVYRRTCGHLMEQVPIHWSYHMPFEVWAVVARYNLPPNTVRRFLCPDKHTQVWYVPSLGERSCDVLVTKDFKIGYLS
jgi:hypothetical protein